MWPPVPAKTDRTHNGAAIRSYRQILRPVISQAQRTDEASVAFEVASVKPAPLLKAIEKPGAELHTQYVVSFVPEASVSGYHTLEVRLARSGEFRIRATAGILGCGRAAMM